MSSLTIRDEISNLQWQVWPVPDPIPPGAVHETGAYLFELHDSKAAAADLLVDDVALEALRTSTPFSARWRWSPGFHAGSIQIELRLSGQQPRRFEVITDPDQRKLTRHDFDAMVREILDDTFALFSLSSFKVGVARGAGSRPPPIARLEFLRSRVDELEDVVAHIARSPRRYLSAEDVPIPYHRINRVSGEEVLRSFRSAQVNRERSKPSRLPDALKGFLPARIRVRKRVSSLDIPEHRQIGACLRAWAMWLRVVGEQLEARSQADSDLRQQANTWAARCRQLSRRVRICADAPPFVEAAEAPARVTVSSLFRRDPAYRRFYCLWRDMDLGIASVFGDFLNMPLARTFELYELWCFLRLVRSAAEEFGPAGVEVRDLFIADASGSVTIAAGAVTVPVGRGWKLCFQKRYREFWIEPDQRGSFSRAMVPDIVVQQDLPSERLIVLDAKYRINDGLNDALSSIHTYRDALIKEVGEGGFQGIVTAAYLVTPHVPSLSSDYRSTPLPGRLFHPEYRPMFRLGAVTLRPGMSAGEVTTCLRRIVADSSLAV